MSLRQSGNVIPKEETAKNTILLGELIKAKYSEQDLDLPKLIFLARGGLEIAGTLTRHLDIGASGFFMAGVERTEPTGEQGISGFKIGQFPLRSQIEGNHLLAIDVVCRSGSKLKFVTQRLKNLGALSAKSAVIYDMTKEIGQTPGSYEPDYPVTDGHSIGYARFHWEQEELIAEAELEKQQQTQTAPKS